MAYERIDHRPIAPGIPPRVAGAPEGPAYVRTRVPVVQGGVTLDPGSVVVMDGETAAKFVASGRGEYAEGPDCGAPQSAAVEQEDSSENLAKAEQAVAPRQSRTGAI